MSQNQVKTIYFHNNYDLLKEEIKNYFIQVYKRYESLFECLTEKAFYKRADSKFICTDCGIKIL